jgi:hypothetical protein
MKAKDIVLWVVAVAGVVLGIIGVVSAAGVRSDLNANVTALNSNVAALKTASDQMAAAGQALTGRVGNIQKAVEGLDNTVGQQAASLAGLQSQVTEIRNEARGAIITLGRTDARLTVPTGADLARDATATATATAPARTPSGTFTYQKVSRGSVDFSLSVSNLPPSKKLYAFLVLPPPPGSPPAVRDQRVKAGEITTDARGAGRIASGTIKTDPGRGQIRVSGFLTSEDKGTPPLTGRLYLNIPPVTVTVQ